MSKKIKIVAITGRSGSGKSQVAAVYAAVGHPVADGDELARAVVQPGGSCLPKLVQAFGEDILLPDGTLNRGRLAQLAFSSPAATSTLNSITHPAIIEETLRLAKKAQADGAPLFFIDAAVVVGSSVAAHCDKIIVVTASEDLLVRRILQRDAITPEQTAKRLATQLPEKELRTAADYVIENNGSIQGLRRQAMQVLQKLLKEE